MTRARRIDAAGEIVEHGRADVVGQGFDVFLLGLGGEGVEVGDDEEALVLVLQSDAVGEGTDVMAEVEFAGRAIAREDAFAFHCVVSDGCYMWLAVGV